MKLGNEKIKKILLDGSYIDPSEVDIFEKDNKNGELDLLEYLLEKELVTKDLVGQAIAESYNIPYVDLNSNPPANDRILKIPESIAKEFRFIIYLNDDKSIIIATDNPEENDLKGKIQEVFPGKKIILSYALSEDIDDILVSYRQPLETRFGKILESENKYASEIVKEIIEDALIYRASDIHFEPRKEDVLVRFRVDGILKEAGVLPIRYFSNILNRIKVQANLRIDDHFSAQDGAIRYSEGDNAIDLRVSIVPVLSGEKIVIRLLSRYVQGFSLSDVGLSEDNQKKLGKIIKKPFGMILVTGPTGSGKTTTLYSILKILNNPEVNITTIEDPVEYRIKNINQIQVNNSTNLSFAQGLRSIVRQDPDMILVGEIRDNETAEISVNAALTGHLLLSTFHSNDAASAIPRLLDMQMEPFLLASTLEVIIAQRLVRKICDKCKFSSSEKTEDIEKLYPGIKKYFPEEKVTLYKGKGCEACHGTGYKGRTAIFEFLEITPEIQELIRTNPSSDQIWKAAKNNGAKTLFEDGIEKIRNGVTTIEEVLRVAKS